MRAVAIIPARWSSTRFPGKPLASLCGKTVIERVYERVSSVIPATFVATDDTRILEAVNQFGGRALMTSEHHHNGTERILEALQRLETDYDVVVNVQGDEPFVVPKQLALLLNCMEENRPDIATLAYPFSDFSMAVNPNVVKVVVDGQGYALYFSRSEIPHVRDSREEMAPQSPCYLKHIGIYAYRRSILESICQLPVSPLESLEKLEQLRWLQAGYRIRVLPTSTDTIGIDTPEDLQRAEEICRERKDYL